MYKNRVLYTYTFRNTTIYLHTCFEPLRNSLFIQCEYWWKPFHAIFHHLLARGKQQSIYIIYILAFPFKVENQMEYILRYIRQQLTKYCYQVILVPLGRYKTSMVYVKCSLVLNIKIKYTFLYILWCRNKLVFILLTTLTVTSKLW